MKGSGQEREGKAGKIKGRRLNRNLQTSKAPLENQAQGTSLFTSAATNQRVAQSKVMSDFQWVSGGRVAVYGG